MAEQIMNRSQERFAYARELMPGGVNSPVRAFRSVGGIPVIIDHGKGPFLYSIDGKEYIDYVLSWGPLILGHAHPEVMETVLEVSGKGTSFGAPNEYEISLAEKIIKNVSSVEKIRFVNSGTEATMSAIRLARGYTKRKKILKFDGCYHGHGDSFLAKAGSGVAVFSNDTAGSPGVPSEITELTISVPYNNSEAVDRVFRSMGEEIAAVIVEPVAANMGVVPPEKGFLESLRKITDNFGALLIFDEVITGFRLGLGGAQELFGITPDLTCFGKIIGGGFPVGAYGGKAEIMDLVAPEGPVYQAGTLSGNPVAMAAGAKTISVLEKPSTYDDLESLGAHFQAGLESLLKHYNIPGVVRRTGSLMTLFFTSYKVTNFEKASSQNPELFRKVFHGLLNRGVYTAPSAYEASFLSTSHTIEQIDRTLDVYEEVFKTLTGQYGKED